MRPLLRPDSETRSSLLTKIFGREFDAIKEYSAGEILEMGIKTAEHITINLLPPPKEK